MRLFIAFDLSTEAEQELAKTQHGLKEALFTSAKHFHLTLKFLGETTPQQTEKIKVALSQVSFKQFIAKLDGIGCFPSQKQARVIWAGIEPRESIKELQKQIDEALSSLFPKEKDFQPHITLARVKEIIDAKQFAQSLHDAQIKPISFQVTEFKLVKSTLRKEGSSYSTLAAFPLAQEKHL